MRPIWCAYSLLFFTVIMIVIAFIIRSYMDQGHVGEFFYDQDRLRNTLHKYFVYEETRGERVARKEREQVIERWRKYGDGTEGVKTILYWNTMKVEQDFMFGTGDIFQGCPVPHCYATTERHLDDIKDFHAILFNGIEIRFRDLPAGRSPHQRYIFFTWESPSSRRIRPANFVLKPDYYNWTISYRLDSDIIRPFGMVRDILTDEIVAPPRNPTDAVTWRYPEYLLEVDTAELNLIKKKKRMAAWFASRCISDSKREILVDELRTHFEVDIYGDCGPLQCDQKNLEDCYDIVERDYYFYLSFENTLCKDYVTEILFQPLSRNVIPVVYGGADYTKFAPPHSYINVMDFNSTAELARFMYRLVDDPMGYHSYFWWKNYYRLEDASKPTLCDLCAKLHDDDLPAKQLRNFMKYYIVGQCFSPESLPWYYTLRYLP
ncbi:alpha-(1,3)-fucosyltransferase C-like [Diachasmimorpha longicaudata]|uniref:alpha-(1,3)-fucosyltransferase C-like n=1 Tax=Diachasmimorpha longicaudata TaxID=58733 RepID=UPI0030B87366